MNTLFPGNVGQQVEDLTNVLTVDEWVDFGSPRNQILGSFFGSEDDRIRHRFFHQLVLSIELYLRLHSTAFDEITRVRFLEGVPPKVAWNLVMAQRWLENVAIDRRQSDGEFGLTLHSKRRQVEALRDFALLLQWPNIGEVECLLDENKNEINVEERSAEALSWFSGVVLPGNSTQWLMMITLIACDPGTGTSLNTLNHVHRNSGFQYRANTYWSHECIVGKVLAAARGVTQVAGWIGPCMSTSELARIEAVQIRQKRPPHPHIALKDVTSINDRSYPLGPPEDAYPVDDYELVLPDTEDVVDSVRVEKLSFKRSRRRSTDTHGDSEGPSMYHCAVTFEFEGQSWDIRLRYDVQYIAAHKCHFGPHVLFYDYAYRAIKVDDLLELEGWGPYAPRTATGNEKPETSFSSADDQFYKPRPSSSGTTNHHGLKPRELEENDPEKVLVIEAFGAPDNAICARAWCAHFGLSAVTADVQKTCMACAIRQAFAARVLVVILVDGGRRWELK